jgi:uncharacterized coiled-coil protein SlyX
MAEQKDQVKEMSQAIAGYKQELDQSKLVIQELRKEVSDSLRKSAAPAANKRRTATTKKDRER